MISNLDSIINIIGGFIWPYNERKNTHFDNEWKIHKDFENYKESGYDPNLNLLTILF